MLTGYKLCMFICVCLIFLAACQPDTGPSPAARDLLLPIEALPEHWELAVTPRPMGPNIGFGDEDDSYASFKLKDDKFIISDHFLLHYPNARRAEAGYQKEYGSEFNDSSIAVNQPWETPPELSYTSPYAEQFRVACTINNVAGPKQVCKVMGQYGRYVSIYYSIIREDTMTLEEFNSVVQTIDENLAQALQLEQP